MRQLSCLREKLGCLYGRKKIPLYGVAVLREIEALPECRTSDRDSARYRNSVYLAA